ncbi:MAG: hypothetical protein HUU32_14625 [Calditrichaceae bacterium]|nr:hypothetical protein [Calditrichia bacterium]NUQ42621.1 hypothetical protein [Calditrichaceae bacterium]
MKNTLTRKQKISAELLVGLFNFLLAACGTTPPDDVLQKSGQAAIVFVKENSRENNSNNAMKSNRDEFYPGSDIFILSPIAPTGELTNLTAQYTRANINDPRNYGAAADPEVSYDGKKILFSMKVNRNARWRIYEMNIDGGNLVQLTDQAEGDDMDPVYLPNGQIMFASTRSGIVDEYERRASPLLHVGDRGPNGKLVNVRQTSFNQSHDANPMVHSSGKIFYSRWEHLGNPNKFPMFVINPDGTRKFVMYGNHSPRESGSRVFLEPRELSDGGIVCSVMERNSPFEGGAIAVIDISKSDDNLTFITPETSPFNNTNRPSRAVFKTPHPIIDPTASNERKEKILVAMSPFPVNTGEEEQVDYGIYVMDKDGKNLRLIYNDPGYNEIDPVPVLPREKVPGGVPQVIPMDANVQAGLASGRETGIFFDGNVYDRAPNDGQMRPDPNFTNSDGVKGQARYLRILEAIPLPVDGNRRGASIGNTNLEKQRAVGYAPIRPDGSFSVEVPANRSLHMQTLDENGMMLVNQITWVQVMPGEQRLCTGCHDSHDRDKIINDLQIQGDKTVFNTALGKVYDSGFHNAVNVLAHPAARPDTVDFFDKLRPNRSNTVQAVFNARCISCHSAASPAGGLRLELLTSDLSNPDEPTSVYELLTGGNGYRTARNAQINYATEAGARRSPLAWVMYHRQLNNANNEDFRPLNYNHTQLWAKDQYNRIDPFLPQNRDLLTLIEWIDAGTQYSNTTGY